MTQAVLLRTETRGAHVREDFQPAWRKHIIFRQGLEPQFLCS